MSMGKFTVVVAEPIDSAGIQLLEDNGIEVIKLPPDSDEVALIEVVPIADALITRGFIRVTREIMEASPQLRVVGVHGVGCDHIDLQAARELGKVVFNTPSALTEAVAEMTMALMLALTRRVVSADRAVRAGKWTRKFGDLIGSELMGKTVGLIGLGRIGGAVARRLKPFGVELLYYDVVERADLESDLGVRRVDLDTLFRSSDIITLHTPLTPQTRGLISKRAFGLMKDGVYLVNTSRGKIIDQRALVEALETGKVAGAALDVFEEEPLDPADPLASMDNVILTLHLGASSREAMINMSVQVAEGVVEVLRGGVPKSPVVP